METVFRTECNGRSKYFSDGEKAYKHFDKCRKAKRDVELWVVSYIKNGELSLYSATQVLWDYASFE